jgi:L-malate glycosyltransferase
VTGDHGLPDDWRPPPVPRTARLRILQVVDSLDGGGAERHVVDLAVALRRRLHDVAVASSASGVLAPEPEVHDVAAFPLLDRLVKRQASLRYARALGGLIDRWQPDIVHAHMYASTFAAAIATVRRDVPLVVTEHTEAPWRTPPARAVSRWTYRRADHIVAVSSAIERLLRRSYGVPEERISFLLPAVPPHTPIGAGPTRRRPAGGPLIGRVCRLEPEKAVDDFLHAAALIADVCPHADFIVVGDGSQRDALVDLNERLGLGHRVDFSGYRPDARGLIADLDVLVVSSRSDGSPLVVLEALEAGVPVVATEAGGIPDQIHDGREGLLVPPGEPKRLAAAVLELLHDPDRRRSMGAAGRQRACELGHDRMTDHIEVIYRSTTSARRAQAPPRHPTAAR